MVLTPLPVLAVSTLLCATWAVCDSVVKIGDVRGLIELSNSVNSGTSYIGTTVLLDSDIDFSADQSGEFKPIGVDFYVRFQGAFDGQGHTSG